MMSRPLLKTITLDVTGTVLRYRMHIGDIYCLSAKKIGQPCPDYEVMLGGYKSAYQQMKQKHPCFGALESPPMDTKEWWKRCVHLSFVEAGYDYGYDSEVFTKMFARIYAIFGSKEPYSVFEDVPSFNEWMLDSGVRTGVITNASERYRETILPLLDLDCYDFVVTCKDSKFKKPERGMFDYASQVGSFSMDDTWLHIGDSIKKDFEPVTQIGGHSILIDRFDASDLKRAKLQGVPVVSNFEQLRLEIEKRFTLPSDSSKRE